MKRVWVSTLHVCLPAIVFIGCLVCPARNAYGTLIIDPTQTYTNSTGGDGLGSFNSSGLDQGFDDNEVLFRFTAAQAGTLTAFTTSFASGGFAPDLTLFADDGAPGDPTGIFITQGSEGITGSCGATQGTDSATGFCLDSYLQTAVGPGSYLLVLTEDPNVSGGDGYAFDFGNAFFQYPPFTPNPTPPPNYLPSQNDFNNGFELFDNPGFQRTSQLRCGGGFLRSRNCKRAGTRFAVLSADRTRPYLCFLPPQSSIAQPASQQASQSGGSRMKVFSTRAAIATYVPRFL